MALIGAIKVVHTAWFGVVSAGHCADDSTRSPSTDSMESRRPHSTLACGGHASSTVPHQRGLQSDWSRKARTSWWRRRIPGRGNWGSVGRGWARARTRLGTRRPRHAYPARSIAGSDL